MALSLGFLGEMEVLRDGARLALPQSKKTRALLAYLVVTARRHRRDRLCGLLWNDVPDDPRGALRWSLSKLRPVVDGSETKRIVADRETVVFNAEQVEVDLFELKREFGAGLAGAPTDRLEAAAGAFRGEFLEGLDLIDFPDFHAWCVAEREEARLLRSRILSELTDRLSPEPLSALVHARALVQLDPLDEAARVRLIRLLAAAGRRGEAEEQYRAGVRLLSDMRVPDTGILRRAWDEVSKDSQAPDLSVAQAAPTTAARPVAAEAPRAPDLPTLVGRQSELASLISAVDDAKGRSRERVVLLSGEPGAGKTRLLVELAAVAKARGATVLEGAAYEAERSRPYGPWIDALRGLPLDTLDGDVGAAIAPLLPELSVGRETENSRDRLFHAVADLLGTAAVQSPPLVLALDDVQWADEASVALLHFATRISREAPIVIVLAAREGELIDNAPMTRTVRRLRQDNLLEEVTLGPLNRLETELLVRHIAPDLDAERVHEESSGNPLFALEIARSLPHREDDVSQSLGELVRDRIERLPQSAVEVLRWAAVLGHRVGIQRLGDVASFAPDQLMSSLETLERHALLRGLSGSREPGGGYAFGHDVVRQAVYAEISEPRRRMMHWRVAKSLEEAGEPDETIASEIAHHASLAGEMAMAARACVTAGRWCLRIFANAEAFALARRGMRYAARLDQPDSVKLMLELTQISFAARRPLAPDDAARSLEEMAERALDHGALEHARLGFNALAYLRWESGEWSDAVRSSMKAELVSRSASEEEQVVAMAEAARCLALLERDMGQAEALLLEAQALSKRVGVETFAISDGLGMLRQHQGEFEEAAGLFEAARIISRRDGMRLSEFLALEHLIVLELQRGNFEQADALCREILVIGEKFREGSEAPVARTLAALCRYAKNGESAFADVESTIEELRVADAKHRLSVALSFAAEIDLRHGSAARASAHAEEALRVAELLGRPSEIAQARVMQAKAAIAVDDRDGLADVLDALDRSEMEHIAVHVRRVVECLREESTDQRKDATR